MSNLRLYSFVTFYLAKGIHAGIQTGHAAVDLVRKYGKSPYKEVVGGVVVPDEQSKMVAKWADEDKTFIVLNGGMHFEMQHVLDLVRNSGYPFEVFHESVEALAGIMTSIVVVLPEEVYDLRRVTDQYGTHYERSWTENNINFTETINPGNPLFTFVEMLKSKRMAD